MRVVLATHRLADVGGSETYLHTVAENLVRLGHEVTVHAVQVGAMADRLRSVGATVVTEDDLPETCDALLVQDVGMAYAMAERWPGLPQVHVAHSAYFDVQLPPLVPVPGSVVVAMSDRVAARVAALPGTFEVVRLRQPIDSVRLAPRGPVSARPRRAVLLSSYVRGEARDAIVEAWAEAKVSVVQVGTITEPTLDVAAAVADADIVVGKGRALLDGMACGRPAFLYDAFGGDGWVTAATYDAMEADAFAGQSRPEVFDRAGLLRALDGYDPGMGSLNRELILQHHQDRKHAEALVGIFRRLAPGPEDTTTPAAELARLSRLRWKAELEAEVLRRQTVDLATRVRELEQQLHASEQRRRGRARAARRFKQRLVELGEPVEEPVDATQ